MTVALPTWATYTLLVVAAFFLLALLELGLLAAIAYGRRGWRR